MAEYIELSDLQKFCRKYTEYDAVQLILNDRIDLIHTADVIERSEIDKAIEESYKKGLTDAWECARKIGNNSQLGLEGMGFDFSELGTYYNPSWWVVLNYDVFKALEIFKRNIRE